MLDNPWQMVIMTHLASRQRSTNSIIWTVETCSLEWVILGSIGRALISTTPIIQWREPRVGLPIIERSLCMFLSSAMMRLRRMATARTCVERSPERRMAAATAQTLCTMYDDDDGGMRDRESPRKRSCCLSIWKIAMRICIFLRIFTTDIIWRPCRIWGKAWSWIDIETKRVSTRIPGDRRKTMNMIRSVLRRISSFGIITTCSFYSQLAMKERKGTDWLNKRMITMQTRIGDIARPFQERDYCRSDAFRAKSWRKELHHVFLFARKANTTYYQARYCGSRRAILSQVSE